MTIILLLIILYLSYYDIRYYKVPNRITLLLFFLVITHSYYDNRLINAITAGLFSLIFYIVVYLLTKGKIGIGDIKFSIISAIYLGFELWLYSIFFAVLVSSIVAGTLLINKKINKESRIPFIPFFVSGIIFSYTIPPFL